MGNTALVMAAYDGSTAIAKALIKAGANLDLHQSFSGATALTMAIWKGDPATVKALIKVGAKLNLPNIVGRTPLIGAVIEGRTAIVKTLIKAGANLDLQDSDGWTALIKAAVNGHTAIVEALIKAGANLDLQNKVSDSRTSPPPFCLNFKDLFILPWTLARAVGGYLVARNLGPKMPKNCLKIKPCRLFGSAVPLLLS